MWEIRVQHEGLKAYRVIRGATPEEAELKANLQMATWDERWSGRQAAQQVKQEKLQKSWSLEANRETARSRTAELEEQIAALGSILKDTLERQPIGWDNLKDTSEFTRQRPTEPVASPIPAKPEHPIEPSPTAYAPTLNFLDRIIGSRRVNKENEATKELEAARADWREACSAIDEAYEKLLAAREAVHQANLKKFHSAVSAWEALRKEHQAGSEKQSAEIDTLRGEYQAGKAPAVEYFLSEVLNHSAYPEGFPQGSILRFNESSGVLIVDFELPNQSAFPATKEVKYIAARDQFQEVAVSDAWLKKAYDDVLYQIALRTLYELYTADDSKILKSIVFNGWVHSIDKATGVETHGCILSVQASREEFLQINLAQVEPKACFRKLKGVASSKLVELTPVRPILTINKEDHRFVEGYAVADTLDDRTNLASMDWLDFENLIRELFEKVFSKDGGEVKITQASRDGGVDAVAFDPDPIRGGKIIIQAKRYTNVVGVSAVRDLFGTVHNEGAIKGILVTTSNYGPDAYEFAKDKPLTLLGGGELLSLLADYGHNAKIDLQEAKALYLSKQN